MPSKRKKKTEAKKTLPQSVYVQRPWECTSFLDPVETLDKVAVDENGEAEVGLYELVEVVKVKRKTEIVNQY